MESEKDLLVLKKEEATTSQGIWVASRSWKRQGDGSSPRISKRDAALLTPDINHMRVSKEQRPSGTLPEFLTHSILRKRSDVHYFNPLHFGVAFLLSNNNRINWFKTSNLNNVGNKNVRRNTK